MVEEAILPGDVEHAMDNYTCSSFYPVSFIIKAFRMFDLRD